MWSYSFRKNKTSDSRIKEQPSINFYTNDSGHSLSLPIFLDYDAPDDYGFS